MEHAEAICRENDGIVSLVSVVVPPFLSTFWAANSMMFVCNAMSCNKHMVDGDLLYHKCQISSKFLVEIIDTIAIESMELFIMWDA